MKKGFLTQASGSNGKDLSNALIYSADHILTSLSPRETPLTASCPLAKVRLQIASTFQLNLHWYVT